MATLPNMTELALSALSSVCLLLKCGDELEAKEVGTEREFGFGAIFFLATGIDFHQSRSVLGGTARHAASSDFVWRAFFIIESLLTR